MKIRVEYEPTPIRHLAVQCPKCEKWFQGNDVADRNIVYKENLYFTNFTCPLCNTEFNVHNSKPDIKEVSYPEVYKGCFQKKVVWI